MAGPSGCSRPGMAYAAHVNAFGIESRTEHRRELASVAHQRAPAQLEPMQAALAVRVEARVTNDAHRVRARRGRLGASSQKGAEHAEVRHQIFGQAGQVDPRGK